MSETKAPKPITWETLGDLTRALHEVRDNVSAVEDEASPLSNEIQYLIDHYKWEKDAEKDAVALLGHLSDLDAAMYEAGREANRALDALLTMNNKIPKAHEVLDSFSEDALLMALLRKRKQLTQK